MSLIYRGTSSDDVHFNVTERRVYNAPAFDVTGIEVPGRSGDVLNSQERFKNKSIVYTGFIRSSDFPGDTTWERLSRGLRTIKAWVCGDAGKYHDLMDDYDPGFVRRAFVSGETAISEVLDRPDGATITITFMAEPFMYEESNPIDLPETGTASGAIASFEGVAAPLQSLKFSIEPKQSGSGDPSPTNIRPISGWSQVDGVAAGVNLANPAETSNIYSGLSIVSDGKGVVTLSGTKTANGWTSGAVQKSITLPAGTYTLSAEITGTYPSGEVVDIGLNGNYLILRSTATRATRTLTVNEPTTFTYGMWTAAGTYDATVTLQLEVGSTATAFKSYTATPITISLGQTVYGGTVDALNGKLVIDRILGSIALSGVSFTNGTNTKYATVTVFAENVLGGSYGASNPNYISNMIGTYVYNTGDTVHWYAVNNSKQVRISVPKGLDVSALTFQCVAELATPIEVDLTPVSVNSQLGQNNVWASCGDTEVVYVEPTENPTEWPSKPRLEITMAGAGTLTVNGKTWSIGAYTGTLICDSEIMDWYDASNLKNSLVSGDGFPELQPGENVITYTGEITKVVAKPRWRTL